MDDSASPRDSPLEGSGRSVNLSAMTVTVRDMHASQSIKTLRWTPNIDCSIHVRHNCTSVNRFVLAAEVLEGSCVRLASAHNVSTACVRGEIEDSGPAR